MTSSEHPGGATNDRLPASVYRRRRLFVLLGVLAIIGIIALVIWKPGSSSGRSTDVTAVTSTPSPSAPAAGAADSGTDAAATPTPTPAETGVNDDGTCKPSAVKVEALTDASTYAAGVNPQLSLSVTNTGTQPCRLNVGTSQQVFTITSGSDQYWTSTDCQKDPADAEVDLEPGKTVTSSTPISWDRTRSSAESCDGERDQAPAGGASYHLKTSVAGVESTTSKQFILN
ncbi:hypothetical protein ACUWEX_12380 [Okibacterium fritillariae]|uniref:DUF4232 domain-containing protein n=1 Tax=Okibacterium fritillariae TaxID=123320 RepID=A0A1T5KT51_9MICO|nr:hypothetical protein [Okibacterium fritillariae]SKC66810.1 hypothetical protein SAMN06309945_2450 [Okibacterium fritillariae]